MWPERTIATLWIAWLFSWGVAAVWSSRNEKTGGIVAEIPFRILILAGSILLFVTPPNLPYTPTQFWTLGVPLRWIMVAIIFAGFSFTWWARICLGRLWSHWAVQKKEGHKVVDTGAYRLVRHPIYTGLILAAFATAIEKGAAFALFGASVIALAFYMKARVEERFLRAELGEEAYEAYACRTPMLVPSMRKTVKAGNFL